MVESTMEKALEIIESNPEHAIIVDICEGFGSPIEIKFPTTDVPTKTPEIKTPSVNPKERGSPTFSKSKSLLNYLMKISQQKSQTPLVVLWQVKIGLLKN